MATKRTRSRGALGTKILVIEVDVSDLTKKQVDDLAHAMIVQTEDTDARIMGVKRWPT